MHKRKQYCLRRDSTPQTTTSQLKKFTKNVDYLAILASKKQKDIS